MIYPKEEHEEDSFKVMVVPSSALGVSMFGWTEENIHGFGLRASQSCVILAKNP